jgi:hypothetical protein
MLDSAMKSSIFTQATATARFLEDRARFVHEMEEWRAGDEVSDERRDVANAV